MKNFSESTKLKEANFYSENKKLKMAIYKAGLQNYSTEDLCLYLECLVEVINERKAGEND